MQCYETFFPIRQCLKLTFRTSSTGQHLTNETVSFSKINLNDFMFHLFFRLSYHYLHLHSAHLIINIILCIVLIGLLLQYLVNVNTAGRHQQAVPAHHAGPEDAEARQGDASSS